MYDQESVTIDYFRRVERKSGPGVIVLVMFLVIWPLYRQLLKSIEKVIFSLFRKCFSLINKQESNVITYFCKLVTLLCNKARRI